MDENFKIYTIILAKALNLIIEYIYSGNKEYLNLAEEYIFDLKELSSIDDEPLTWWISRLILILLNIYKQYSFWSVLPTLIPGDKTTSYIQQLAFNNPSIIELFYNQYKAVDAMKNNNNIVISLPTSSGKTRIAEIAILKTLVKYPKSKVLYLAPFRSLSFEIEESINKIFSSLGFSTTSLYGSTQYSKIDKMFIENSNIIIATPEKAKAIIRANEIIANQIKLLIIDEGHLLGKESRLIKNEMFIEELKFHINKNNGKIILLSAVLPNTKDISKWISNDENNILESKKRLAGQRFGILKWTKNKQIKIEWLGKTKSYNNNFVKKIKLSKSGKFFPETKKEGFAAAALKLSELGTVLLFVARANRVLTTANLILKSMEQQQPKIEWKNKILFESFRLTCNETGENEIFKLAEYGILCHHGKLSMEVRNLLEKIMREEKSKIIVSTSTLGQGVNIGISTVIFLDVYFNYSNKNKNTIEAKDFWNIAGRAGRTFVDIEGKILYAIDASQDDWKVEKNIKMCEDYFNISNIQKASSGLLFLIKKIKLESQKFNIDFKLLLQLISENDLTNSTKEIQDYYRSITEDFELIDDTLLALDYKHKSFLNDEPSFWIDDFFRNSLAYIQAKYEQDITQEEIIQFLKARNKAVMAIAKDSNNWESIIQSCIPLNSSVLIEEHIEEIKIIMQDYDNSDKSITNIIEVVKKIESLINQISPTLFKHKFDGNDINEIRNQWFSGVPLSEIKKNKNFKKICAEYFSMTLPWVINAIVRKLYDIKLDKQARILEDIALLSEIGLPNVSAVKIYLSGIKSRVASLDLSKILNNNLENKDKRKIIETIISNKEKIKNNCLDITSKWVDILSIRQKCNSRKKQNNVDFSFKEIPGNILNIRKYNNDTYLCSPDFKTKIPQSILQTKVPISLLGLENDMRIYYKYNNCNKTWLLKERPIVISDTTPKPT